MKGKRGVVVVRDMRGNSRHEGQHVEKVKGDVREQKMTFGWQIVMEPE